LLDSVRIEFESGLPETTSSSMRLLHRVPEEPQSVFAPSVISQPVESLLRSLVGTMRVVAAEVNCWNERYPTNAATIASAANKPRLKPLR